jgi:hypothetical protein
MLNNRSHTSADVDLRGIAKRAMLDRGFLIQVPEEAQSQLKTERAPAFETLKLPDMTSWMWSSIDNDDSRDLDQIEYAKKGSAGQTSRRLQLRYRCGSPRRDRIGRCADGFVPFGARKFCARLRFRSLHISECGASRRTAGVFG